MYGNCDDRQIWFLPSVCQTVLKFPTEDTNKSRVSAYILHTLEPRRSFWHYFGQSPLYGLEIGHGTSAELYHQILQIKVPEHLLKVFIN